ncbi:hypothetical protein Dvina_26555 [Dactylosporangium vinaceum]|nr:hypothetical protein Dvina_26555 [Dactylosporangium vinaceum]
MRFDRAAGTWTATRLQP